MDYKNIADVLDGSCNDVIERIECLLVRRKALVRELASSPTPGPEQIDALAGQMRFLRQVKDLLTSEDLPATTNGTVVNASSGKTGSGRGLSVAATPFVPPAASPLVTKTAASASLVASSLKENGNNGSVTSDSEAYVEPVLIDQPPADYMTPMSLRQPKSMPGSRNGGPVWSTAASPVPRLTKKTNADVFAFY